MIQLILAILLIASTSYAGGLYDQTNTPIAGEVVNYRRMPYAEIINTIDKPVSINMTTETVRLYPDSTVLTNFLRRVSLDSTYFAGKNMPLINPLTGQQIGYLTTDQYYAMTYSIWLAGEKQADGLLRFKLSDPQTIYYTTSASDPAR